MVTSATTDNQTFLADVPQELVFWCNDGQILKNLKELRDALAIMNDYTFTYHVNEAKNDFYTWVRDVVRDDILANELLGVADSVTAVRVVAERITSLDATPASVPVKRAPARKPSGARAPSRARAPSSTSGKGKSGQRAGR